MSLPQDTKGANLVDFTKYKEALSSIVNDLNNILVGIVGNARFLREENLVKREGLGLIESILSCADRSKYLSTQLQDLESVIAQKEAAALELDSDLQKQAEPEGLHLVFRSSTAQYGRGADTVLIIDDEEVVRHVSRTILEKQGYRVISTGSGCEGIEIFEQNVNRIFCVLLDLTMPYIRGNLVFARLRARDPEAQVILMSGYSDKQVMSEFEEGTIAGFLQKPFAPTDLTRIIEQIKRSTPPRLTAMH